MGNEAAWRPFTSSEDLFRFVGGAGTGGVGDRLCTPVMTRPEFLLVEPELDITNDSCSFDIFNVCVHRARTDPVAGQRSTLVRAPYPQIQVDNTVVY